MKDLLKPSMSYKNTTKALKLGTIKGIGKKEGKVLCIGLDLSDIYRTFIRHLVMKLEMKSVIIITKNEEHNIANYFDL